MYSVKYSCTNCGWEGSKSFSHGSKAPSITMCPNCRCISASKQWPKESYSLPPRPVTTPLTPLKRLKPPQPDWEIICWC